MAWEVNATTGEAYVIGGVIVRFSESTSKRIRMVMAAPGREVPSPRKATDEEKALTYPTSSG